MATHLYAMALGKVHNGIGPRPVIPVLLGMNRSHLHIVLRRNAVELLNDQLCIGAGQRAQTNCCADWKVVGVIIFEAFYFLTVER